MHHVQLINRMNYHNFPDTSIRATFNIFIVVLVLNFDFTYPPISTYLHIRDNPVLVLPVKFLVGFEKKYNIPNANFRV